MKMVKSWPYLCRTSVEHGFVLVTCMIWVDMIFCVWYQVNAKWPQIWSRHIRVLLVGMVGGEYQAWAIFLIRNPLISTKKKFVSYNCRAWICARHVYDMGQIWFSVSDTKVMANESRHDHNTFGICWWTRL